MEKTNSLATLEPRDNHENGHLICNLLNSFSSAHTENYGNPILLGNGAAVPVTSEMGVSTIFKTELDGVIKQIHSMISRIEEGSSTHAQRSREIQQREATERAMLEAKLNENEEAPLREESAGREPQENLSARVHELETLLEQKEALLETSNTELENLWAKVGMLTGQVTQLQSAVEQAEAAARTHARNAQEVKDSYEARNVALESKLREAKKTLLEKDAAIEEREENLTAKVRDLETLLQAKTGLLQDRQTELKDLQAKFDASINQRPQLNSTIEQLRTKADSEGQRAQELEIKYAALEATLKKNEERLQDTVQLGERMSAQIHKLTSELQEKKIALASYEITHWRSVGRRNWWKRVFNGEQFGLSGPRALLRPSGTHGGTGSLNPLPGASAERKQSRAKLYIAKRHKQNQSNPKVPLQSKRIVDLTADQIIQVHAS